MYTVVCRQRYCIHSVLFISSLSKSNWSHILLFNRSNGHDNGPEGSLYDSYPQGLAWNTKMYALLTEFEHLSTMPLNTPYKNVFLGKIRDLIPGYSNFNPYHSMISHHTLYYRKKHSGVTGVDKCPLKCEKPLSLWWYHSRVNSLGVVAVQHPLVHRDVLSNPTHRLVQWKYTKPAQINSGTGCRTVSATKIKGGKGQRAGYLPNTLILANRPRICV